MSTFSQEKKGKYDFVFSPEIISQKKLFGGANLLIGRIEIEKYFHFKSIAGVRVGFESNFKNNENFIIAPKVGFEISAAIIAVRLSAVNYFQNNKSEFRIVPEIGISLNSFVNLTYGYNFRITNKQIDGLNGHRFCLSFNINNDLFD